MEFLVASARIDLELSEIRVQSATIVMLSHKMGQEQTEDQTLHHQALDLIAICRARNQDIYRGQITSHLWELQAL